MKCSASELADILERGEGVSFKGSKLVKSKFLDRKMDRYETAEWEIQLAELRQDMDEFRLAFENSHYHPDCIFRDYDWNSMYEEDGACDDRGYISNMRTNLARECRCPDHQPQAIP